MSAPHGRMGDDHHRSNLCAMRRLDAFILVFSFAAIYAILAFTSGGDDGGVSSQSAGAAGSSGGKILGKVLRSQSGGGQPIPKSLILPMPMDFIRRGYPLQPVYNFPERNFGGECSCMNPKADDKCCGRNFRRAHKMGTMMTEHIFDSHGIVQWNRPYYYKYESRLPDTDYRDVYLLRNIYSSLVSGFLFHQEGKECDRVSSTGKEHKGEPYIREWFHYLSWAPVENVHGRTMCEYLAEEPEETAMHAYIEWAFRYQYVGLLSHLALARELPEVKERTMVMCYELLSSPDTDKAMVDMALKFWFNGTEHGPYTGTLPGHQNYTGGHSTPHDPVLRGHLVDLIKELDEKYYNGEIAWLNEILPC